MGHTKSDFMGREHRWAKQTLAGLIEEATKDPEAFVKKCLEWDMQLAAAFSEMQGQLEANCLDIDALEDWELGEQPPPMYLLKCMIKGYLHDEIKTVLKYEPEALATAEKKKA